MSEQNSLCPVCDFTIVSMHNAVVSELMPCPGCGTDLEVVQLNPIVLKEAPKEEEDWGQ